MRTSLLAVVTAVLLAGCSGVSALERCVEHSVEEGVSRERAEQGCRDAVGED